MSAATELQAAVVAALAGAPGIAGVAAIFDGPPPLAPYPYVAIGDGLDFDWSTKTERGREHRLALTILDEAGRTARLQALVAAAETAIAGLPRTLANSRIVSLVRLRTRLLRTPGGPWAGLIDHRVRTLQI